MILMILIEPLTKILIHDHAVKGEKTKEKLFGGFCVCGGIMYQKSWFHMKNIYIVVSECEKCWRNEAMAFNGSKTLVSRDEVEVVDRTQIKPFLKRLLSPSEYEALIARARGEEYSYNAYSRAKNKLAKIGLSLDEILGYL